MSAQNLQTVLQSRVGATMPVEGSSTSALVRDIRRIADVWNAHSGEGSHSLMGRGDAVTMEGLSAQALEMGVELTPQQMKVGALGEGDFPAIMMLNTGESIILLQRLAASQFKVNRGGQEQVAALDVLEKNHSGILFFVRPRPMQNLSQSIGQDPATLPQTQDSQMSLVQSAVKLTLKDQKKLMSQLIVAALLSNLFMLALPLYSMVVYDRVVPHNAYETLFALSLGVVVLLIADFSIRFVRLKLQDAISLTAGQTLQARVFRKVLHSKMEDAPRTAGGLTNSIRDIDTMCQILPQYFVALVVDLPFFVVILLLMASLGGWVALPPIVGFLLLIGFHAYGHMKSEAAAQEVNQLSSIQTNMVTETVESLESTKVTGAEGKILRKYEQNADSMGFSGHIARLWNGFSNNATLIMSQLITVAVVIVGVFGIGTGALTVGSLTACTLLVGRAIGPVGQMVALHYRLKHSKVVLDKMDKFLSHPSEEAGDKSRAYVRPSSTRIDCQNLSFQYAGEQSLSLAGLNFTIQPGEKVGLIGKSGSGKSTFLRLVPRLQMPTGGNLLIGGQDIRQYHPRALREQMGFMRQDPVLYDDTIRANITYGLDSVNETEFERAVTLSGVKDFAARHPQGFGYRVGPRGEKLSGGERQAVWLARALLVQPKILILDEPTASMDSSLEAFVIQQLKAHLPKDTTLIMATHRAPVLEICERVIWFDHGKVIADGATREVLGRLNASAKAA